MRNRIILCLLLSLCNIGCYANHNNNIRTQVVCWGGCATINAMSVLAMLLIHGTCNKHIAYYDKAFAKILKKAKTLKTVDQDGKDAIIRKINKIFKKSNIKEANLIEIDFENINLDMIEQLFIYKKARLQKIKRIAQGIGITSICLLCCCACASCTFAGNKPKNINSDDDLNIYKIEE